jgi:hypothetical protein
MNKDGVIICFLILISLFGTHQNAFSFEPDCHYAWTYYLALHVGYTPRQAFQLASAAYAIDEDKDTGPMEATAGDVVIGANHPGLVGLKSPHPKISEIWRRFHAFSREGEQGLQRSTTRQQEQDYLWNLALQQKNPGPLIHYTQDIYSHSGWDNYNGHALGGHKPDYLSNNPQYSELMTIDTIRVLKQFKQRALQGEFSLTKEPDMTRIREVLNRLYEANPAPWQVNPSQYVPAGEIGRPDLVPAVQVINSAIKEDQAAGRLPRFGEELEDTSTQLPDSVILPSRWHQFEYDDNAAVQAPLLQGYALEEPRFSVSSAGFKVNASETYTTLDGSTVAVTLPYEIAGVFKDKPLSEITVAIKEYNGSDPGNTDLPKLKGYFHTIQAKDGQYEVKGSFGVPNKDLIKGRVWIAGIQLPGLKPVITKVEIPCDQNVVDTWIGKIYDGAIAISGGRACSVIEDSISLIKEIAENMSCPRVFEAQAKIVSLNNKVESAKQAAEPLRSAVATARSQLKKCDLGAADSSIELARQALSQLSCDPGGDYTPTAQDISDLQSDRNFKKGQMEDFLKKIAQLRADAEDAASRCDLIDLDSAARQLQSAIDMFSSTCSPPPPEAAEATARIQELISSAKNQDVAKATIQEADAALKTCDVDKANDAAKKLRELEKVCGMDLNAEVSRINDNATKISKALAALSGNVDELFFIADAAYKSCDVEGVKRAAGELNRIVDSFTVCPDYPETVRADTNEVQRFLESMLNVQQISSQIDAAVKKGETAMNQCDADNAKKQFDEAVKLYNDQIKNQQCQVYAVVQKAAKDSVKANELKSALKLLSDAVTSAHDLLLECPADFSPMHQKLKGAEFQISEIKKFTNSCELNIPTQAIADIGSAMQQMETTRKNVSSKIQMAKSSLKAQGVNAETAQNQARNYLQQADQLLMNAQPEECYTDLSLEIELLHSGLDDLTASGDDIEEIPGDDDDPGDDRTDYIPQVEDIPDEDPQPAVTKPQPVANAQWILESVAVFPAKPDPGWSFGGSQASSAQLTVYNGDKAVFQWTPPPQQIGTNGFPVSLSAQGQPANPAGTVAALISVTATGLEANLPSNEWSAYARTESGPSSASKQLNFKLIPSAYEVTVQVSLMWGGLGFIYKYRKI